jgi:hypothetical protein
VKEDFDIMSIDVFPDLRAGCAKFGRDKLEMCNTSARIRFPKLDPCARRERFHAGSRHGPFMLFHTPPNLREYVADFVNNTIKFGIGHCF